MHLITGHEAEAVSEGIRRKRAHIATGQLMINCITRPEKERRGQKESLYWRRNIETVEWNEIGEIDVNIVHVDIKQKLG